MISPVAGLNESSEAVAIDMRPTIPRRLNAPKQARVINGRLTDVPGALLPDTAVPLDRPTEQRDVMAMGNDWISQALMRMLLVAATGLLLLPAAASAAPPPVGGLTQLPGQLGCFTTAPSAS